MVKVSFTPNLNRHLSCPEQAVEGATVGQALQRVFVDNPRLASYILDDQGSLRKHVAVFVDGRMVGDRRYLSDTLTPDSEIYVAQALSGG
ncbi:MoaD/ThiS family protein [Exilibacterium tricleocarpae]|uniref:MoaD/ThiS family protein n=1 Tax=Exilibacterium tricleocarpae TaxID=2591008 RepID=A0A545TLJ4_9GAMM|nr:MoaD/ThiS family protein [Exilibacterium tricleocarpae]TQV78093.1 MoaD/ThiS family protein [Exilibacterium tricleocarpae]